MVSEYKAVFGECFCGNNTWDIVYSGPVRQGRDERETGVVGRCKQCGVERLDKASCENEVIYENNAYREVLGQKDSSCFIAEHDVNQSQHLAKLWPMELRGKIVADVGAAAGSLLDHVAGLAAKTIAIEPCKKFHQELHDKCHWVFPYAKEAARDFGGRCDFVFCMDVIEHVEKPIELLQEMAELLKPDGKIVLVTPNRNYILKQLIPEVFLRYDYRTVHTWYFDRDSLKRCAELAGLSVKVEKCIHRWGISNFVLWLKDHRPSWHSEKILDSPILDACWISTLETAWLGDNICQILTKGVES